MRALARVLIAIGSLLPIAATAEQALKFSEGAGEVVIPDDYAPVDDKGAALVVVSRPEGNVTLYFELQKLEPTVNQAGEVLVRQEATKKGKGVRQRGDKVILFYQTLPAMVNGQTVAQLHWQIGFGNTVVVVSAQVPEAALDAPDVKRLFSGDIDRIADSLRRIGETHRAIEAVHVFVVPPGPPAAELQELTYPNLSVFHLRLKGFEPGRSYSVRALVLDAKQNTAAEHSWTFATPIAEVSERFDIHPGVRHEPGEWRLVVEVDGVRIADRSIPARRVGQPPAPPLTLVRALVSSSISGNHEPRRPLEVLGIPSAAYYYLELSGFVPGRGYKYRIAVTDGDGKLVSEDVFLSRQAWRNRQIEWFPFVAQATHAPGTWTLRLELDDEPVAQTTIEARRGASRTNTAYLERLWPAVAAALVLIVLYVGYSLATVPGAAPTTPPVARRPLLDPSLVMLVAADLLPIAFVLYAGSDAKDLLFVYGCETVIVAAYAIPRILMVRGSGNEDYTSGFVAVTIFVLFFTLMTISWGAGIFYYLGDNSSLFEFRPEIRRGLEAAAHQPSDLWNAIPISVQLAYMLAALFVSHGLSFVQDYLKRGAYLVSTQKAEMVRPINRLALIYLAFVATGAINFWGKDSQVLMLALLVALKTVADVYAQLRANAGLPPLRFDDD